MSVVRAERTLRHHTARAISDSRNSRRTGDHFAFRAAMEQLAVSRSPEELNQRGFALYEAFRPAVPAGARGWGASGELNLDQIVGLTRSRS